jgi:hypothetical protein
VVRLSPASPHRASAKNTGMQNDPVAQRSSSAAVERFPRGSWLCAPSRRRIQGKEETGEREAPTCACGSSELAVRAPCSIRQRPPSRRTSRGWMRPRRHLASRRRIGHRVSRRPGCHHPDEQPPRRAASSWEAAGGVEGGGGGGKPPAAAWIERHVKRAPPPAWISPPRMWTFVVVVEPSRVLLPRPPRAQPTTFACSTDGRHVLL